MCKLTEAMQDLCMGKGNNTRRARGPGQKKAWLWAAHVVEGKSTGWRADFAERVAAGHGRDHAGLACLVRRGCGSHAGSWWKGGCAADLGRPLGLLLGRM